MGENFFADRWKDLLLFIILAPVLSWGLVCGILGFTELQFAYGGVFGVVLGICVIYKVISLNKYTVCIFLAISILFLLLVLIDIFSQKNDLSKYTTLYKFVQECVEYALSLRPWKKEYEDFIRIFLFWAVPLFVTFVGFSRSLFIFFALCGCGWFGYAMYVSSTEHVAPFLAFADGLAVLFVKKLYETSSTAGVNVDTNRQTNSTTFTLICLPIAVLAAVLAYFLPKPAEGKFYQTVSDVAEFTRLSDIGNLSNDIARGGFVRGDGFSATDGKLGGNAVPSDTKLFEVYYENGENGALVGAYKDTYTGRAWIGTETDFFKPDGTFFDVPIHESYFVTNLMILSNYREVVHNNWQLLYDPFTIKSVMIKMLAGGTRTIFHPQKTFSITADRNNLDIYINSEEEVTFNGNLRRGDSYYINYYTLPSRRTRNAALMSKKGLYQDIYDNMFDVSISVGLPEPFFFEQTMTAKKLFQGLLIPYSERVYEKYCGLPANLPGRVGELAQMVTNGENADYYKALAIETYLQSEYFYTLTPGGSPWTEDFVDYFLFEAKKGYCTSFASAFVVMCRTLGIPARYVEGYIMPDMRNDNGAFVVTDRQGHAWGEAYFEGVGWVPFDPTPSTASLAFANGRYVAADRITGEREQRYTPRQTLPEQPEFDDYVPNVDIIDRVTTNNELNAAIVELDFRLKLAISVVSVFVLIMLYTLVAHIIRRSKEIQVLKNSNNMATIYYYKRLLNFTQYFHYEMFANETAGQFSKRAGKVLGFENDTLFLRDITKIYNRAAYGKEQISTEERDIVVRAYKNVDNRLKGNVSKTTYFLRKYVLLKV